MQNLEARSSRTLSSLSSLHSAQNWEGQEIGPAAAAIFCGIRLFLDMKGLSDHSIDQLSKCGVSVGPKALRKYIQMAASSIESYTVRADPPPGMKLSLLWTTDNADFHLFSRVLSVIPIGNLLLGYEATTDVNRLETHFTKGLKPPSDENADQVVPTKIDDEVAKKTIQLQNIRALMEAAVFAEEPFLVASGSTFLKDADWHVGDNVSFRFRHSIWEGIIAHVEDKIVTVTYEEKNGDQAEAKINLSDVIALVQGSENDAEGNASDAESAFDDGDEEW